MGKNEAQKQKKLAKKRSRELAKKKEIAREKNRMASFAGQWDTAMKGEFGKVWIGQDIHESGIGQVLVTRKMPDHRVVIVRFLVDAYCLGVKDVEVEFAPPSQAAEMIEFLEGRGMAYELVTPADAAKVVLGARQFAHEIGIEPHPSFAKVSNLFDDVDTNESKYTVEFGKDGNPVFMPGPNDSPERIMEIVQKTRDSGNEAEIDYSMVVDDFAALNDPELDVDIDEDVDPMVIDALASSTVDSGPTVDR